jgi:hypothetical protein
VADPARRRWLALAWVALLPACAPQPTQAPRLAPREPPDFPHGFYRELRARGQPVYAVDATSSLILIEVRRGGSLARFGHDHVVASRDVAGLIAPQQGRADFFVPLERLVVDEPRWRVEAGFDTQPSESDIAATHANMLTRVLEVERYPFAQIAVSGVVAEAGSQRATLAIGLHGTGVVIEQAVDIERDAVAIRIEGRLALEQSRFGIVPFSILGGAIQVQDRLVLRFRLRALRIG